MSTNEQNVNNEQTPSPEKDDWMKVTEQERQDFLNRQGWEDSTPEGKQKLEDTYTDAMIRMSIDQNLA